MPTKLEVISKTRVVEDGFSNTSENYECGCYHRISHQSVSTNTKMIFGLFLPSAYKNEVNNNIPVLYWLSGLTCDDTNFPMKAGSRAFATAESKGIAIVIPDTSPRHDSSVPDVDSYDLGIGAGFYVNAIAEPYKKNYKMYDYITKELPEILGSINIGKNNLKSIAGHSMGGHGALTIALKDSNAWKSVSAFAPIANPTDCPWGKKAFIAYLGDVDHGKEYDATCLLEANNKKKFDDILIDQGTADNFLKDQLKPEALISAAEKVGQKVTLKMRKGFDHSYYFIAAFIESHVEFHSIYLKP